MKCDGCHKRDAVYRIHAETPGMAEGGGGVGRNSYSCHDCKDALVVKADQVLSSTGKRHMFGEIQVDPI